MNFELLNPAMLTALGVAVAPFVVHLLSKRRPRNWEFPSIRFLREVLRRRSRIHRLRDLILLALRTLAVILLVFTFARPILRQWAHAETDTGGNEVLILFDDSLSMGYRGNPSPFDAARAKATEILESLSRGDSVNLWYLTRKQPLLPHFSENLDAIGSELRRAAPTQALADVPGVLDSAREFLRLESARSPLIYVLSDFQRNNWAPVQPEALALGARVVLFDAGRHEAANRSVREVRVRPARPAAGERVTVTCQVANYGPAEAEAEVRFVLGGAAPQRRGLMLPPFGTADVTFHLRFEQPGIYRGTVAIGEDRLPEDDGRSVVFRVEAQVPVVVITDADPNDAGSGAYFLRRAIAPSESGLLRAESLRSEEIALERLRSYEVALVSEVKLLPRAGLEALHQYLQSGGSVIYFLTRAEDRGNLVGLEGVDPERAALAFRPEELFDLRRFADRALTFAEANYDSPLLAFFRDPQNGDLSTVHVHRFFTVKEVKERAEVFLKYSDGTVALAQARTGAGALVLANFSPRPDHSDLARRNVFPPLVHELVKGLRFPPLEIREVHPGEAASAVVDFGAGAAPESATITVRDPSGETVPSLLNIARDSVSVTIPRIGAAGFYTILADGAPVETVVVNPHPDESDLRPMPVEGLNRLTQAGGGPSEVRIAPLAAAVREIREGKIVWPWVLLGAFLVLLMEGTLAHLWRIR